MKYVVKVEITIEKVEDDHSRVWERESCILYEVDKRLPDATARALRAASEYRDSLKACDWAVSPF